MSVKRCAQCAADFSCQANHPHWCTSLPILDNHFPREYCCLCIDCQESLTLKQIDQAVAKFAASKINNSAAP